MLHHRNLMPEKHLGKVPTETQTQLQRAKLLCCFRQANQSEQYVEINLSDDNFF